MTELSFPFDGTSLGDATLAPYSAQEWATYWKNLFAIGGDRGDYGVIRSTGGSNTLESLQVTQNSPAAANVLVNPGSAMVNGTGYINDSTVQVTIAANASGNPRIDTIVLRKTFASNIVRVAILQGTPAATPAVVALTQTGATWEIPLADIAVANGFATITIANITPRANYMIAPDAVYLEKVLNNDPSNSLVFGDACFWDTTADRAVSQLNASVPFKQAAGAFGARTPIAGYGRVNNRGIGYVKSTVAATRGQYGYITASGTASSPGWSDFPTVSTFCRALQASVAYGVGYLTLCMIDAHIHTEFGLVSTSRLTGAAAAITASNLEFHNTLVIEFYLRSAVVAISETINLRFGGTGGLDLTAGNYFSYAGFMSNSTPALVAVQNLGATAGVQLTAPGSTAPAGSFSYGVIHVNNAIVPADVKHLSGHYYVQSGIVNATLFVGQLGARWLNALNLLSQLSFVSASASNFAAGSYVNIYAKQVYND